jgi:hypothetical protein
VRACNIGEAANDLSPTRAIVISLDRPAVRPPA